MKTSKILVAKAGAGLSLQGGGTIQAIYPLAKGEKYSYFLDANGTLGRMGGSRIQGVSVARYFTERGFALAEPGNEFAAELAAMVDCREGLAYIEKCSIAHSRALTQKFGGQKCTAMPFDSERAPEQVIVSPPRGSCTTSFDLVSGISSGVVSVEYSADPELRCNSVTLSSYWLVGPSEDETVVPRCTEYGGVVEHAAFVVSNSGIGSLVGPLNLAANPRASLNDPYPKGALNIQLLNGDLVTVGIDAGDELGIRYTRKSEVLYSIERAMPNDLRLGSVVGVIASVIIRVQEMDAVPVKAPRARAKKSVEA
jgi:hypothetical protein